MRQFASYVILAPLAAAMAGPAMAQNIPAGQSCGGLFCDMGIIGHKLPVDAAGRSIPETPANAAQIAAIQPPDPTRLPCHDFLCHAFGQPLAEAAPAPVSEPIARVAESAPATPAHKARRRHLAKATQADSAEAAK